MTFFGPQPQRLPGQRQNRWFLWFLWLLFFLYWAFAYRLERVDLQLASSWQQIWVPFLEIPEARFIVEMFHWRVLRHLIAPIVGWQLAQGVAVNLIQTLYDLPDKQTAKSLLKRLQLTKLPAIKPLAVSGRTLIKDREKSELLRVGGPGRAAVIAGDVAVTELNGRFHRILGPGIHTLGRLEHIHTILDLRPQERIATDARLLTRDGIEIKADINVAFRLDTGDEFPSKSVPYPYDEDAVRLAAYNKTVLPDGSVSGWDNAPLNAAKINLVQIIARYRLDELLHARSAADPYRAIRTELIQKIRPFLLNQGIELTSIHISRLELPPDVANQYIRYWQTHWETKARLHEVDGEAMSLEEIEIARAEAEMTMIQAIVEGVQRARKASAANNMNEIIALRLVEAMEKVARQSQLEYPLPTSLLPQINTLRQQLQFDNEPPGPAGTEYA
ncbi:MAG: SPFH domain-containing protein [Chloroflexi bacterium]|nr:SPFH domain-containing protein [Chloroflexota bacterium]